MADLATREAILKERAERLTAQPRTIEPGDWGRLLGDLITAAEITGDEELAQRLRHELYASTTHANPAGLPERPARFAHVLDPLRGPEALSHLASIATDSAMPPLVRAHLLDFVWSLEEQPKAHPLAGAEATGAYLDYVDAVEGLPSSETEVLRWFALADALARSCELATSTNQAGLARRAADAIRRRLAEADTQGEYRMVLEPGYGLIDVERLVPGGLASIDEILERATRHFLGEKKFHLARSVLELQRESLRTRRPAPPDRNRRVHELQRRIAESYVSEADDRITTAGGALVSSHFIQQAITALQGVPDAPPRIEELTRRLERDNQRAIGEMKPITVEVKMPTAEIQRFIARICDRPLPDALTLIGIHFLSDRTKAYEERRKLAGKFVLSQLVSSTTFTSYGQTKSFAPGTPERLEHEVFTDVVRGLSVMDLILVDIFKRLRDKGLTPEVVMEFLRACPFFRTESLELIEDGVSRVFGEDYVGAVHVLTPQIEAVLRSTLQDLGLPITRVHETETQMTLLDGLVRLAKQAGVMDDRIIFTLEAVLTESGRNVRNDVAHGWFPKSACTPSLSLRLLQLLLTFALLRPTARASEESGGPSEGRLTSG